MEKLCWEPSTTTAVSWGSPPLSRPSPPVGEAGDRLGHPKMWKPGWGSQGGGEELGARAAAEEGTGTFSERGEGARHLFASPADFLGCGLCCLCTKLFLNTMMCVGCRTLSKAGLCPGSSISSRCSTAHLKLSVAPVQPKTQNLLIVFCADV